MQVVVDEMKQLETPSQQKVVANKYEFLSLEMGENLMQWLLDHIKEVEVAITKLEKPLQNIINLHTTKMKNETKKDKVPKPAKKAKAEPKKR